MFLCLQCLRFACFQFISIGSFTCQTKYQNCVFNSVHMQFKGWRRWKTRSNSGKSVTLIHFFVSAYNVMNWKWVPRFSWVFSVALNSTLNAISSPKIFQKVNCYSVRDQVPNSVPELYMKTFRFLCFTSRKMVQSPTDVHTEYRILCVVTLWYKNNKFL